MSISSALSNAMSGLTTTSRMAEIVSSNLSNALTDGYGRRSLELSARQVGGLGAGVQIDAVTRFVDAGLLADRRLADSALAGQDRSARMLVRLEQALGGPDDPASLGATLARFEQALISASSDPASETRLNEVLSRLTDVTTTLQRNTDTIQSLRQEADAKIASDVDTLNAALLQVEAMNADILRLRATGNDVSSLLDSRQQVVDKIADIVPVREIPNDNGTIRLMTTTGTTLLDGRALQFGFERTPTIVADMTLTSGALSGITLDGAPLDPVTGVGRLDGGSLGASFVLRDQTLVEAQNTLDGIAADLIARFEDSTNDPTLGAGDVGMLTDEGGSLDLADINGLAERISVNPVIDPAQGGILSLIRDGLNAASPGPVGSASQINRWIDALSVARTDVPGSAARSAVGRMADFTSQIGLTRLNAEEDLSFTSARWDVLHEAELSNGVDTDLELQTLMRVEQAYAANAKVIQTVDFMMQRLMEI